MLRILDKDGKPKFVWKDEDTEPRLIQDEVKEKKDEDETKDKEVKQEEKQEEENV